MKILNLGSLNIDRVYAVPHFVQEGETLSSPKMEVFCGGKGLNQSLALARAGAKVLHVGAAGPDGDALAELLAQAGADTAHLHRLDTPSGHAIIQVDPQGHNCIIVSGGANALVTPSMVDAAIGVCAQGDWLLTQNETACVAYAFHKAKAAGMKIAFNPSPVDSTLMAYPLDLVDLFVLNEAEGAHLADLPLDTDPKDTLAALTRQYPAAAFALTLGGDGALCLANGHTARHGIFPVQAVDTTAAGDTFCGYFLTAFASQLESGSLVTLTALQQALRIASAAAAIAVSRPGAGPSIPTFPEVEGFLRGEGR